MDDSQGMAPRSFTLVSPHPRVMHPQEGDSIFLKCEIEDLKDIGGLDVVIDIDARLMAMLAGKTIGVDDLAVLKLIQERHDHEDELADMSRLYLSAEVKMLNWMNAWRKLAKRNLKAFRAIFDRSGVGNSELAAAEAEYRKLKKAWERGGGPDED